MTAQAHSPALSQLLTHAATALQAVRSGRSATVALAAVPGVLRSGTQALLFQVLRNLGRAQALRRALAPHPPPPLVDALLCTALALLWHPQQAPYASFTLVNQAVQAAGRSQRRFINACLRRFLRERDTLVSSTDSNAVARWNYPQWWIDQVRIEHPAHWQQILQAGNAPPPMTLRIARHRSTPAQYCETLAAAGIAAWAVGIDAVILHRPLPVGQLPGFAEGVVSVQDAAAQWAAPLLLQGLDSSKPLHILDACAAPGGKTAHLLECAQALGAPWKVTALDVDATRAVRIQDSLQRMQLHADVLLADAADPSVWSNGAFFDAILLDAPCTASGIVRRHPDVRWLRRASDIAQLAAQQARLLNALWSLLKTGGRLLYCTCSVFHAEGQMQVQTFLAHHKDVRLLPSPGHLLPSCVTAAGVGADNGAGEHDGFFYALLHKEAS